MMPMKGIPMKYTFTIISMLMMLCISVNANPPKIVGLVAARNEALLIEQCLRSLACYADEIAVLDDCSTDNTVALVESLADECRVKTIIKKTVWARDELADKNSLLLAGRALGGTHFIMLDADEMFVATAKNRSWLRRYILSLKPGQVLRFPMINVWGGIEQYRNDEHCHPFHDQWKSIPAVFCDDGVCSYNDNVRMGPSGVIHVFRYPLSLIRLDPKNLRDVTNVDLGILHFKCVNLPDLIIKKVWYMCLEYIHANTRAHSQEDRERNAGYVNNFYAGEFNSLLMDPSAIKLAKIKPAWLKYDFFTKFNSAYYHNMHQERLNEIKAWFIEYGLEYFKPLAIWHVDYIKQLEQELVACA
jgi:glycosyltransferase involved in cell wall biosynthesis